MNQTDAGARPAADEKPAAPKAVHGPDAIIYVPGLRPATHQLPAAVAAKIAEAFTLACRCSPAQYVAKAGDKARVCGADVEMWSIQTEAGGLPIVDVFAVDYETLLRAEVERQPSLLRFFATIEVAIRALLVFVRVAIHSPGRYRNTSQAIQALLAVGIILVLGFYLIELVIALAQAIPIQWPPVAKSIGNWLAPHMSALPGGAAVFAAGAAAWEFLTGGDRAKTSVAVLTALGIVLPQIRRTNDEAALLLLALDRYFRGDGRDLTTARFLAVLAHVANLPKYERVHVVTASFGGILALDAMYYTRGAYAPDVQKVDTFVTIGIPLQVASLFYRQRYEHNYIDCTTTQRWFNVCCPVDVLASQIALADGHDDDELVQAKASGPIRIPLLHGGVRNDWSALKFSSWRNLDYPGWYPSRLRLSEIVSLSSFRLNGLYWRAPGAYEYSCFWRIVRELWCVR